MKFGLKIAEQTTHNKLSQLSGYHSSMCIRR